MREVKIKIKNAAAHWLTRHQDQRERGKETTTMGTILYLKPKFKPTIKPYSLSLPVYANAINNLRAHGHRPAVIRKVFGDLLAVYELLNNEKSPASTGPVRKKLLNGGSYE